MRQWFLLLCVLMGACSSGPDPSRKAANDNPAGSPPTVILISIDTLRADRLSAYGYSGNRTAAIDQFAADSLLFRDAVSAVPITLPSHASIMTGQYPIDHGVRDNSGYALPEEQTTLAEVLRQHGFSTAAFVAAYVLDSRFGLDQGFDLYSDDFETAPSTTLKRDLVDLHISERPAAAVLTEARRWFSETSSALRFAFIHLFDPHAPYAAPAPFSSQGRDSYDGEVAYVDAQLGAFFEFLRQQDLYDDALIVLLSDHGEGLGDHGEDTHGMFLYDSTLHVPLLIKLPGEAQAGRAVSEQVRLIDVMPTILGLLHLEPPAGVRGSSLEPLWKGGTVDPRPLLCETQLPYLNYGWAPLSGVRSAGRKLILAPRPELYELANDPGEQHNRVQDAPDVAAALRALEQQLEHSAANADPTGARREVDPETVKRLQSLGYLGLGGRAAGRAPAGAALADPKDKIELFNRTWQAQGLTAAGDYPASIALLTDVLRQDPTVFMAHSIQSLNYLQSGRPLEALPHLKEASRLRPDDFGSRFYAGIAQMQIGNPAAAAVDLEAALRLDPESDAARNNLGTVYVQQKRFDEAAHLFRQLAQEHPQDIAILVNLGVAELMTDNPDQALAAFDQVLQVNPNIPEVHNNRGLIFMDRGEWSKAISSFERALALKPDYPNARRNLERARQARSRRP